MGILLQGGDNSFKRLVVYTDINMYISYLLLGKKRQGLKNTCLKTNDDAELKLELSPG